MKYRRDIDGLRALAVLPVVAFHAFPRVVPGGFVGVDIFFVISGYLITRILVDEAQNNRLSIANFYVRRARRILPALVVMAAAVLAVGALVLIPSDLRALGSSAVSVAAFASNIYFYLKTGYFGGAAEEMPLLHTWSLAVEEQFYIVWPLLIWLLFATPLRRWRGLIVVAMVAASFAASQAMLTADAKGAFYLPHSRAWELGLGAVLSLGLLPPLRSRALKEALAALGLLLILASLIFIDSKTPFPGLGALAPCLGAALLLYANEGTPAAAGRLLSAPPLVAVGLISYSLYLWHWPMLVFPPIVLNREMTPLEIGLAVLAAFVLATLSFRFVERPFRKAREARPARTLVPAGASMACVAGAALSLYATHGFAERGPAEVGAAETAMKDINPYRKRCHVEGAEPAAPDRCRGGPGKDYQVLLWGDSHADHLMPGLADQAAARGITVRQATKSSCSPLAVADDKAAPTACEAFNAAVLGEAARNRSLRLVVMSARWTSSLRPPPSEPDASEGTVSLEEFEQGARTGLSHARAALGPDVAIVVVGSSPEYHFWPAKCLARAALLRLPSDRCLNAAPANRTLAAQSDQVLQRVAAQTEVAAVAPWSAFCRAGTCSTGAAGRIFYYDDDHLTTVGSKVLGARVFAPTLRRVFGPAAGDVALSPSGGGGAVQVDGWSPAA